MKTPPAFQWLPPDTDNDIYTEDDIGPEAVRNWLAKGAHEELAPKLVAFLLRMHHRGHTAMICQLHRTPEQQAAMYAQGRTTPGRIVTDAQPWQSAHCVTINGRPASMAFDICILIGNRASWEMSAATAKFWSDARDTGNMLQLVWGATFNKPPRDFGHFQLSTFKAIKK